MLLRGATQHETVPVIPDMGGNRGAYPHSSCRKVWAKPLHLAEDARNPSLVLLRSNGMAMGHERYFSIRDQPGKRAGLGEM
jgi:hypothetical protein